MSKEYLIKILAIIGCLCLSGIIFSIIASMVINVKEQINLLKWRYKYKHRFDKLPIAKCYCKDCKQHDSKNSRCYKFRDWYTADNWFCWDADPLEKEVK